MKPYKLLVLVVVPISLYSASIELVREQFIHVPVLQDEILDLDIKDIDGDGHFEILACDSLRWVLYSANLDTVIATDVLRRSSNDSAYSFESEKAKVLLLDVDHDSMKDVVVSTFLTVGSFGFPTDEINLMVYYAANGFENPTSLYFDGGDCYIACNERRLGDLTSVDFDHDNTEELVLSFHSLIPTPWSEWTFGMTYFFDPFPDSLFSRRYFVPRFHGISISGSTSIVLETYEYSFSGVPSSNLATYEDLWYFDSQYYLSSYPMSWPSVGPCASSWLDFSLVLGCSGNIDTLLPDGQFIVLKTTRTGCQSRTDLSLNRLVPNSSIIEIWSIEDITQAFDNFVYLPQFPGFYFAFVDNSFTQFNGEDGTVFQFTTNVPVGKREWFYFEEDSIPRLIVRNGALLEIYITDVSTPVIESQSSILPKEFQLSAPYPNPFNPEVSFTLSIPKKNNVKVEVFDILGRRIYVLHDGILPAGNHNLTWNSEQNPSGAYFFKATSEPLVSTVKAILLK
jgi:hypothetical protein